MAAEELEAGSAGGPGASPHSSPGAASSSAATDAAAAGEAADTIFRKIMGRSGQYLTTAFGSGAGFTPTQASPQEQEQDQDQSTDSMHSTASAAAVAAALAAAGWQSSYDMGGPGSSSSIGLPGASASSTTPLEMGQGPASDQWGGQGHPGFFGKNASAERRRRRRPGPSKWCVWLGLDCALPGLVNWLVGWLCVCVSLSSPKTKPKRRSAFVPPCLPRRLTRRQLALCAIGGTIFFIILIVLISAAAKRRANDMLLKGGDNGAAERGVYRDLFHEYLGKTPAEVDKKLE